MIEDVNILENSVALLINKSSKKIVTIQNYIEKIRQQISDQKIIKILDFTKNQIYLFKEIQKESVG